VFTNVDCPGSNMVYMLRNSFIKYSVFIHLSFHLLKIITIFLYIKKLENSNNIEYEKYTRKIIPFK
jgi:hypothetical protein